MAKPISEQQVEQAALGWFEALGFDTAHGADLSPGAESPQRGSFEQVVLESRLRAALHRINSHLPDEAIEQAARVVTRPPEPTLEQNNRWLHRLLCDGVDVEYRTASGETRGDKARLLDTEQPACNDWLAVNQLTVQCGNATRRPDLVVFVNGLPLVVIELKDPGNEQADLWTAYRQLQDYKESIPALFTCNALLAISDGDRTRVGSLTAGADRFAPWRATDTDRTPGEPTLETFIRGLFEPGDFIDYLRHCMAFRRRRAQRRDHQESGGLPSVPRRAAGAGVGQGCPESPRRAGRWARRRYLAYPRLGQEPDHAYAGRGFDRRRATGQPHHSSGHRPQRPGRTTVRHLRRPAARCCTRTRNRPRAARI